MLFKFFVLASLFYCALSWEGVATNWCDSINIPGYQNTCQLPIDGYYGALSDAQFPDIIKCECTGSTSSRWHPTLGNLQRCSQGPNCWIGGRKPSFCGRKMCVECTDSKCKRPGQQITITLSDACPQIHPANVDNCANNAPNLGYCNCIQRTTPTIDLGCIAFKDIADEHLGNVRVRVTDGPCGSSGQNPPSLPPPPAGGDCNSDISPDQYSCPDQARWLKCNERFMQGFCVKSCNRCGGSGGSGCTDISPDKHSCPDQARWLKCGEGFMQNFCHLSCGRCGRAVAENPTLFNNTLANTNTADSNGNAAGISSGSIAIIVVGVIVAVGMVLGAFLMSKSKSEERV